MEDVQQKAGATATPAIGPVGIVMGSTSDWPLMQEAANVLEEHGIAYEAEVVSAHRTPDRMFEYGRQAEERGLKVIIAGAGGAAHLPGMLAALTVLPVIGVPIPATVLDGTDALHSIVQMPRGTPVGTMAIGKPGAANAGFYALSLLAMTDDALRARLRTMRADKAADVLAQADLRSFDGKAG
jgi:5-(carboxyamino)imidazole ribonucleotide mutase